MSFTFKGGGDIPKTVAFRQLIKVANNATIAKGHAIELNGVKHQVVTIKKIEIKGGKIFVSGKAAPIPEG